MSEQPDTGTLRDELARQLRACAATADGVAAPAAILWTDPERQWVALHGRLLAALPELVTLGDFDPSARTGPAIWLRCMVERALDEPALPPDRPPVVYLPGIGRQRLRAGEDCPPLLQPLVELMYRGTMWLQKGGHDWTLSAFLTSPRGLDLDVARGADTIAALVRALRELATTPIAQLRGRRLEADDFDRLLMPDPVRDVLRWMGDPRAERERMGAARWDAFRSQCRTQLSLDPESDGETTAAERLAGGDRGWDRVWARFSEAPEAYPGIAELLARSKPAKRGTLPYDRGRWPDQNDKGEAALRTALADPEGPDLHEHIAQLESAHGERRAWVWARLGRAPLARVLEPLAELARRSRDTAGGRTPDDIGRDYAAGGWRADAAAWRAMALAPAPDEALVHDVVRGLLERWLDGGARAFQAAARERPLPARGEVETVSVPAGGAVFFVDGLRYDLGCMLAERLSARGCRVRVGGRWAALPTVTATGKPAVAPVADDIRGGVLPNDFAPALAPVGKPANAANLRAALERSGYQILRRDDGDGPRDEASRGWIESGDIDHLGHDLELGLARQIDDQLDRLAGRIAQLMEAGWTAVRVVTDHGWLLLPGGLPRVDLPKHLTASRWSRCAAIAGESRASVPTAPWHWNTAQRFAVAPGIACFNKSPCYAHGGLSIQECLIPDLLVEPGGESRARAAIRSLTWRGMRCFIEADTSAADVRVDLRLERATGISVARSVKALDADGVTSLVLGDDTHEHDTLVVVLLAPDGTVLARQETTVGEQT